MQSIGCRAAAPPECLLHLLLWWIKPEPGVRAFFRLMKISVCRAAAVRRLRGARSGAHGLVAVTGRAADSRRPTSSRARPAPGCRRSRRNAGRVAALRAAARRASSRAARGRPRCACRAPPVSRRSSCRRREPVTRPKSAMSWRGAASVVFFSSGIWGWGRASCRARCRGLSRCPNVGRADIGQIRNNGAGSPGGDGRARAARRYLNLFDQRVSFPL